MDENKRWFILIFVQCGSKPIQLFFAQITRRGKRLFQGIQNKPIRAWRSDKSNLFVFERPLRRFFLLKNFPESLAIVVITQSQMNRHLLRPYGVEELRNRRVIPFFT